MDIVYGMPGQNHRLFINVVHACPNACLFCVDFKGDTFYGFELKNGRPPTASEIVAAVEAYPFLQGVRELYYCGIGEPLLRCETVVGSAKAIRALLPPHTMVAVNTSGTFYIKHPRVDFARDFDLIQVSLNAESEEKYNAICRPKVRGAYNALMTFLRDLHRFLQTTGVPCRVELSVVDTSDDVANLPNSARSLTSIPTPDLEACHAIAESFGWPLKAKKLITDCERSDWNGFPAAVVGEYRSPLRRARE